MKAVGQWLASQVAGGGSDALLNGQKVEKTMTGYLTCLVATAVFASSSLRAQTNHRVAPAQNSDARVTSVTGESWLNHLHRSFNETSMGRTYQLGPRAANAGEGVPEWESGVSIDSLGPSVILRGRDLYRLNCQGCHRESGTGAPPEINSIINAVRATSTTLVIERMKRSGMEISRTTAAELARQAEQALTQRLHTGGQDMPTFGHLDAAEFHSLVAYLNQLADVPGGKRGERIVSETPVRVGELIVKSTCHICHDATGPNPNPEQLEYGLIPPLATLTARTSLAEFVRKVTVGAPLLAGNPPRLRAGRMPVFHYLSQNEAAAVYLYLTLYLPSETGMGNLDRALPQPPQGPAVGPLASSMAVIPSLENTADPLEPKQRGDWVRLLILGAIALAVCLVAGGLLLTWAVFRRSSSCSEQAAKVVPQVRTKKKESFTMHA